MCFALSPAPLTLQHQSACTGLQAASAHGALDAQRVSPASQPSQATSGPSHAAPGQAATLTAAPESGQNSNLSHATSGRADLTPARPRKRLTAAPAGHAGRRVSVAGRLEDMHRGHLQQAHVFTTETMHTSLENVNAAAQKRVMQTTTYCSNHDHHLHQSWKHGTYLQTGTAAIHQRRSTQRQRRSTQRRLTAAL